MKRLVQFNELVFNHTAFVAQQPEIATEFRISKFPYANRHGDYSPERRTGRKVNSKMFSITFDVKKSIFNCEEREYIEQFVQANLYKIGRLWAVQGDLLLWAVAKAESVSEGFEDTKGTLTFTATMYLPDGFWYIADPTATYLEEYHECDVLECFEVLDRPICECCWCNIALADERMCFKCSGQKLCETPKDELSYKIGNCGNNIKINYSCDCQEPNKVVKSPYGQTTASADFQANTLYETDDIVIEICGKFKNLMIDFNGEFSQIIGEYDGKTIISGGVVQNGCDYIDIDKFHGICGPGTCPSDDCDPESFALKSNQGASGIVHWMVNTGKNVIRFYGFSDEETQEISIYVRGIAL
ncbi:hypothetical protein [Enterococcus alishanensis]